MSGDEEVAGDVPRTIEVGESLTAGLERVLGPDHPDTLNARNNLAAAYQVAGRAADAIPLFEHTLVARERVLGPNHPDTLSSQNDLAAAYQHVGRHAEAILLFKLIVAARERLLGADHPSTLNSRGNLAAACRAAEAIPLLELTLEADDDPPPEPAPTPEPEPEPETPEDVSEPGPPPAVAEAPLAQELPIASPVEEPPGAPAAEELPGDTAAAEPDEVPAAEPPAPSRDGPARRRRRVPSLVAAIVVLLAAGSAAAALSWPHVGPSGHGRAVSRPVGSQTGSTASRLAAAWVAQQVSRSAIVACDPRMCAVLEARGVPAANVLILRTGTTSPLAAQLVVVTPAVRSQFGSRVDSVYAPSVIADFGLGADQVSVQVIAKDGPGAYLMALRQDVAARKAAGTQLLANKRIRASAEALAQLAAGAVDSRLLIVLPVLAAVHPIEILAFGQPAPGAGPGVPLCSVDLSGSGQAAGMTDASYLNWLTSFMRAQLGPFEGSMAVLTEAGQPVVRVMFAQPSPLGQLAHA